VTAAAFAVVFIAMLVGHHLGDRWLQTDHQATTKGSAGIDGWLACARHVASYTAATSLLTVAAVLALHIPVNPLGIVAAQLLSAGSHLIIDRRYTLRWVVHTITRWNRTYYDEIPGGAEHLDQAAHTLCLFAAALLAVTV
jgi:hypothetical protein